VGEGFKRGLLDTSNRRKITSNHPSSYSPSRSVPLSSPPNTESDRGNMKFINLTAHSIDVYRGGEKILSIPPSGIVLRAPMVKSESRNINGIPVYTIEYHLPELPEERDGVVYIVSSVVLQTMKVNGIVRDDIVAPDTSDPVRDSQGRIVGVRSLVRVR
jgi:hypothetical protein